MSGSAQQALHREVLKEAEYVCYYCGLPGADRVDHIIARSDGGSLKARSNLGAIHQDPCHEEKTQAENARRRERRRLERERAAGQA
jgi:5-methylcytosine-specific restriction endonuclease McrA